MPPCFCPTMRFSRLVTAVLAAMLAGCSAPSLVITPVWTQRELEETELSRDSRWTRDKILIVDVSGVLSNDYGFELLGKGEHAVSLLREKLDKARRDDRVRAVVLRINSPGGTVTASDLMYDEIMRFRAETGRPVIAMMMDVAASGGYYIACACDDIIAHPSTVTGSIGVIMQLFNVSGTMQMIGVRSEAITSGPRKDAGSPFRDLSPEEREIFQTIIDEFYSRFVGVVLAGRPILDEASVRAIADGRVYTGRQAVELGLVDRVGGIRTAVAQAKHRAGIEHARLVMYHRSLDYRPNYYAHAPATAPTAGTVNFINLQLPENLYPQAPRFLYLWQPGG